MTSLFPSVLVSSIMQGMTQARWNRRRVRFVAVHPFALAGAVVFGGCGGAAPQSKTTDVGPSPCPAGQKFDGEYCVPTGEGIAAGGSPATPTSSGGAPSEPLMSSGGSESYSPGAGGESTGGAPPTETAPSLATPVDITMAAAAGPMVQYVASTHLPAGSRPFGAPFAGQFQEGQVLLQRLQVSPTGCYTVIAFGPSPIEDIRVGFYAVDATRPLSVAAVPLLEETDAGSQAVLGRKEQCFKPTLEQRDLWLVVSVERGRGVVAAQVFQKEPSAR